MITHVIASMNKKEVGEAVLIVHSPRGVTYEEPVAKSWSVFAPRKVEKMSFAPERPWSCVPGKSRPFEGML